MLDTASRSPIGASRSRPIPLLDPPPRRMRESERRLILAALAAPPPVLPTDGPDLTPLLAAVDTASSGDESPA
jgi:hypothetical protein